MLDVLVEYVEVVELVSPISISTMGTFPMAVHSSLVKVPCRSKGICCLCDALAAGPCWTLVGVFLTEEELCFDPMLLVLDLAPEPMLRGEILGEGGDTPIRF